MNETKTLDQVAVEHIEKVLLENKINVTKCCKLLGISRTTLCGKYKDLITGLRQKCIM